MSIKLMDKQKQISLAISLMFLSTLLSIAGCASQEDPFDRVAVSGTVTLDGQALAQGMIYFIPEGENEGPKTSVAISDGNFTADALHGPLAGKHRIEIVSTDDGGYALDDEQVIDRLKKEGKRKIQLVQVPFKYNKKSTLSAELTAAGPNDLSFNLNSK